MKASVTKVITFEIDDDGQQVEGAHSEPEDFVEDKPMPMPDSLKQVFAKKTEIQYQQHEPSLFRKQRDAKSLNNAADSVTVQE